jgi:hypothetical protein
VPFCHSGNWFVGAGEKEPPKPDLYSVSATKAVARGTSPAMPHQSVSKTRCAHPSTPSPGYPAAGASMTVAGTAAVGRIFGGRATVPPRHPPRRRPSPRVAPSWPCGRRPVPAYGLGPAVKPAPGPCRADLTERAESRVDACGPGRQASPPRRPATGPAASTPGNGGGAHEVTARDRPAPAPAGLPLRPPRAAACRRPGGGRT